MEISSKTTLIAVLNKSLEVMNRVMNPPSVFFLSAKGAIKRYPAEPGNRLSSEKELFPVSAGIFPFSIAG
jgi:hypothetical protein